VASRIVTLSVLLAGILLLGLMFYQVIAPFLLPMFLAAVLALLCRPLYLRLLPKLWNRPDLTAGVATAMVMLLIVTPLAVGTLMGAIQLSRLTQEELHNWDWTRGLQKIWTDFLEPGLNKLQERFPEQVDVNTIREDLAGKTEVMLKSLASRTFALASSTVGTVLSLMVSGGMFLVAFYYFLSDGPALVAAAEALIPVPLEHQRQLQERFAKVVRAVVLATFLAAFAQGLATAIALQVVGMRHFFIFLLAASITALVPLAGTWMVWGPCAIWLAVQGHYTAAVGLTLFGVIVVGLLDNVIRTYVLNSDAQLHPLLAFVSVLGALQVMGLWGIFFGPIIASCLYALVQIFLTELDSLSAVQALPAQVATEKAAPPVVVDAPTALPAQDNGVPAQEPRPK
jgi:predicted PurR-regulated permease PerM